MLGTYLVKLWEGVLPFLIRFFQFVFLSGLFSMLSLLNITYDYDFIMLFKVSLAGQIFFYIIMRFVLLVISIWRNNG